MIATPTNLLSWKNIATWPRQPLFWILVVALGLRVLAALMLGNTVSGFSGAHDEISYSALGHRWAEGHGLTFPVNWYPWIAADAPQSYYSASMSLMLGLIYWIFGYYPLAARLIMGVLSTAVVGLLYLLSRHIFNERVALVTAALAAVYSYLIFYGVTLVTETPFIFGLLIALYLCYEIVENPSPAKWLGLGLALAVTVLFRMAVIFFIPFLLAWVFYRQAKHRFYVVLPVLAIVLAVMPFTIRNYMLWGQFELLETQFGHVFWNGNHPDHNGDFHPFKVFPIPEDVLALDNDSKITKALLAMGVENVLNDPGHFILLTITRLREFFKFWPTADSSPLANLVRIFSFGLLWPVALAGIAFSLRQWRVLSPLWLFMLLHTGVYGSSWTMIRYRVPLDAILVIFAGLAVTVLVEVALASYRQSESVSVSQRATAD